MVKIGEKIEEFELDAYHANEIKRINSSKLLGKWVVLAFYPADFTFVCPTELEELAENYDEFKKLNAEVLSISADTVFVHKAWHETSPAINKVKYPMLSDPTGKVSKQFGCYIEDEGHPTRATFIIDSDGILRYIEMHDNSIGRSAKEILRKLRAIQFVRENPDHVCPASWEPGRKTLKHSLELVGKI